MKGFGLRFVLIQYSSPKDDCNSVLWGKTDGKPGFFNVKILKLQKHYLV